MAAGRFEARLRVLESSRALSYGAGAAMVAGIALFATFLLGGFVPGMLGLHVAMLAAFVRAAQVTRNLAARTAERPVVVTPGGVTVDGRTIPRGAITGGWFQPRPARGRLSSTVCLRDRWRRVVFQAEVDEERALELLRVLGLDAGSKRAEFGAAAPAAATFGRYLAFVATMAACGIATRTLLGGPGGLDPSLAMLLGIVPTTLIGVIPSKIIVGVDGILLRWLWWTRFIPMADVAAVVADGERAIRIQLRSGKSEFLYTSNRRSSLIASQAPHRDAIQARILEARRMYEEGGPAADVASLVARGARTAAEWRRALDELRGDRGYRATALRDEDLWRVIEDPRAGEDARAGAAVLLRARLDDEGRARVRVAAEASASPRLRVALDAAAAGADAALDAALDELATDEPPRARAAG